MRTIKGFTLIEIVIVMLILGIVLSATSVMLSAGFRNYFTNVSVTTLSNQAILAMGRMTRELQQASSFSATNSTNMSFTTTTGSTITYNWSSSTLTRTGTTTPQTLSNQVTSFSLAYYQSNFSTITSTSTPVLAVTINMVLSNGNETVPLINTVYLSNM